LFEILCKCGEWMKEYFHTVKEPTEVIFHCEECGEIRTIPIDELRKLYSQKRVKYTR